VDKRALIVRFSSLGDVVLTSCLIDPLIKMGYRPVLLTFTPYGEPFLEDPRLEVLQVSKEELFKVQTIDKLRGFDLYIDLHKNLKSFLLRLMLGGVWVSYRKESLRRRLAVYLKSFRKPYSVVDAYMQSIGVSSGRPKILISQERLELWEERLGKGYVCIGPGARYEKKRYPYFKRVVELLTEHGYSVVLLGDSRDRAYTEGWKGVNLCGELELLDVMAVLKNSSLFIGNDSGLLHMARAAGIKAIQVYGGTHPTLGFSLSEGEGKVIIKGLQCQPCHIHGRGSCKFGNFPCLQIEPSEVFREALSFLPG
jgi:ADP-heptose:LPS heptosyltransferase